MKILTLAAGIAVGYVLGTKAGREKYEQIAATARKARSHPAVVQAQEKAKGYLQDGGEAVTTKLQEASGDAPPETPAVHRARRTRPAVVAPPSTVNDPLV